MSSIGKSETTRDTAVCGGVGGGLIFLNFLLKNITFPVVTFQNGRLINLLIGDP